MPIFNPPVSSTPATVCGSLQSWFPRMPLDNPDKKSDYAKVISRKCGPVGNKSTTTYPACEHVAVSVISAVPFTPAVFPPHCILVCRGHLWRRE